MAIHLPDDSPLPLLGSIGAMKEDAGLLDEIVAEAYRQRREEFWREVDLCKEITIGIDQADRGQVQPFNEDTTSHVKARGRKRLVAQYGSDSV